MIGEDDTKTRLGTPGGPEAGSVVTSSIAGDFKPDYLDQTVLGVRPVNIEHLVPGRVVPLDLFWPRTKREDDSVVLTRFVAAGQAPTKGHLDAFISGGLREVFVKKDEMDLFVDYLADRAMEIASDPSVPVKIKATLLHDTARHIVDQALCDSRLGRHIGRSRQYIDSVIDFVSGSPEAVQCLTEMLATDGTLLSHSVNVCLVSVAFAAFLGLDRDDELAEIGLGAMFHDVGMRKVPDEIRNKTGPLNQDDWRVITQHPIIGSKELRPLIPLSTTALRVVRHHHENLDGTGYPEKLAGEGIEPVLRLMRITDAYEAITSRRPWRAARRSREAVQVMLTEMDGVIDVEVLRRFISFLGYAAPRRERTH